MQPVKDPRPGEGGGPAVPEQVFNSFARRAAGLALRPLAGVLAVAICIIAFAPREQRSLNYFLYQIDIQLAKAAQGSGDPAGAIRHYTRAIGRDPRAKYVPATYMEYVSAYGLRAKACLLVGDLRCALKDYDESCRVRGGGSIECSEGRTLREQYTDHVPAETADEYYRRGMVYGDRGLGEKALADLDKAIELQKDHADALYQRMKIMERRGRQPEAARDAAACCAAGKAACCHQDPRPWQTAAPAAR